VSRTRQFHASVATLILTGVLAGCAVYQKCGSSGCPGDAEVTAEVRARLSRYPALAPGLVDVRTWDHVVYLYGLVNTEYERRLAESTALEAAHAQRVVNLLGVQNGGR
jgi:osmotically-inducible protein OsmY